MLELAAPNPPSLPIWWDDNISPCSLSESCRRKSTASTSEKGAGCELGLTDRAVVFDQSCTVYVIVARKLAGNQQGGRSG